MRALLCLPLLALYLTGCAHRQPYHPKRVECNTYAKRQADPNAAIPPLGEIECCDEPGDEMHFTFGGPPYCWPAGQYQGWDARP